MQKPNELDIHSFLYRRRRYCGQFKPETLVFNANLQEFAQRVSHISNLETAGKLSPQESSLFCYFGESKIRRNTHTAIAKVAGEARKLFMKLINLRNPRWKPGILNTCNQGEIKQ